MEIAIAAIVILVLFLVITRTTRAYLYIWIPLVANLTIWGCLGALGTLALLLKPRIPGAADMGGAFLAVGVGYIILLAIASIAVFPPRKAWTRQAILGPLILASVTLICISIPLIPLLRRFLGEG